MARISWSFADVVAMTWILAGPVLVTAACGAMLVVQNRNVTARVEDSVGACNARAASSQGEQARASDGIEAPYGLYGLTPASRASESAREAYRECMDTRGIWPLRLGEAG